ncbi:MAG: hypothetical protein GOMPHAMPRED_000928 [Gomphillus americanus]|uniref:NAD-dependent epimerase/dehydratase domain-containing protein n=1 Tax=Gomphillus americanus TaxID=1940652 RepID=A0A8H3I603_9LECA|nr:MAG: hypothetical protein GOMPHAMPRED_000928 [Gomphillus americanus]
MKVIIAGATGFVGGALVEETLTNPTITSIHILSRRPLSKDIEANPKITVHLQEDLTQYTPELLEHLKDAQCCLWAIGGRATQFSSVEEMHKSQHDTTLSAAKAFAESLASPAVSGRKFRFVFCSGKFTEWDQDAKLWFMSDSRKSKGFVEKGLFDIASEYEAVFEVYCVRPGGIVAEGKGALNAVAAKMVFGIGVDVLAKAMCRVAIEGHGEHIIENDDLVRIGRS